MWETIVGALARILGFVLERLPVRGDIRITLDVHEWWLMATPDQPRTVPVTNEWMAKVRELAAKPSTEYY